jgi:hypothetical protein
MIKKKELLEYHITRDGHTLDEVIKADCLYNAFLSYTKLKKLGYRRKRLELVPTLLKVAERELWGECWSPWKHYIKANIFNSAYLRSSTSLPKNTFEKFEYYYLVNSYRLIEKPKLIVKRKQQTKKSDFASYLKPSLYFETL